MLKKYIKSKNGELILILVIVLLVIILSVKKDPNDHSNDVNTNKLINDVKDNYSMKIFVSDSFENKSFNFSTDSDITLIDKGDYSDKGYLLYKNETYLIDTENYKLTKTTPIDFIYEPFINMELIKKLFNHCDLKFINDTNKTCTIKINDYLKEYNNVYNTDYSAEDGTMTIYVCFYPSRIYSISLEYTDIDRIINNGNDTLKYELRFTDFNNNDFNDIKKYYKDVLK